MTSTGDLYRTLYNSYKYTFHRLKGAQVQKDVNQIWKDAKEKYKKDRNEFNVYISEKIEELKSKLSERKKNFFSPNKVLRLICLFFYLLLLLLLF